MARMIDADILQELCNKRIKDTWNSNTAPVSWAEAYADFKDDINSIPTLTPPNDWISVEDRLPESEKPVLTFVGYPESMIGFITVSTYYCFDKTPHWQWDGLLRDEQRTLFWMPLPQPPKEAQP